MWNSQRGSVAQPREGDEALAQANDGELGGEGQIGRIEEEDLVQLLPLVLPSPQVEDAQPHGLAAARDRRQAHYRVNSTLESEFRNQNRDCAPIAIMSQIQRSRGRRRIDRCSREGKSTNGAGPDRTGDSSSDAGIST